MLTACTSEKIVYRDREPFNPPVDAASGFLGYYNASTKVTACGNCHVGHQRDWKGTRHASAFKTLADLPAGVAQPACYDCHTVGPNGNKATGNVGYKAVKDSAYYDVQCEACHGPGFTHVQNPEVAANWPLPRIGVDPAKESCVSCHSGTHHPFAEEWSQSGHAEVITAAASRPASDGCPSCHEARSILKAWGVRTNFVEAGGTNLLPQTCSVCHNPHGSENSKQLRFAIDTPDPEQNLCMKCHMRRFEPDLNTTRNAPHAPQGAVLLGTAGYRPSGFTYDEAAVLTSHASEANPRLCAGCHVNRFTVTDQTSGNFVFQATGHLFSAIPCLDNQGKPVADDSCPFTETARSWNSCVKSGCHATAAIAAQRVVGIRGEIAQLADPIWVDSNHNENIDPAPIDGGYLATLKASQPNEWKADAVLTPAEGAEFNMKTVAERYANGDKSKGVHNPFLARALLAATLNELRTHYSLPAPPAAVQALADRSIEQVRLRQPGLFTGAAHTAQR
jgi:predicted CXXCH cytochrome family protein